jgi:hypothetical protein
MRANPETGLKVCSKCRVELPVENFYRRAVEQDKLDTKCRVCRGKAQTEYRLKNLGKFLAREAEGRQKYQKTRYAATLEWRRRNPGYHWRRKFNLSLEDIATMKNSQTGKCPGCLRNLEEVKLCVDHCHTTGKVRGLLCDDCNVGIGRLRDDPTILHRLIDYLCQFN